MSRFSSLIIVLLLSVSAVFAYDYSANLLVSIVVFLVSFTLLVPALKYFIGNYAAVITVALAFSFLLCLSVYYNPGIVSFFSSFGPYLIILAIILVFLVMFSRIKDDNLKILIMIIVFVLIGVLLYLKFAQSSLSGLERSFIPDNLAVYVIGVLFVITYLLLLRIVFFR